VEARAFQSGQGAGNGTVPISVEAMSDPLVTNDRRTGVPELAPPVVREIGQRKLVRPGSKGAHLADLHVPGFW
jgi:hypothetical protein